MKYTNNQATNTTIHMLVLSSWLPAHLLFHALLTAILLKVRGPLFQDLLFHQIIQPLFLETFTGKGFTCPNFVDADHHDCQAGIIPALCSLFLQAILETILSSWNLYFWQSKPMLCPNRLLGSMLTFWPKGYGSLGYPTIDFSVYKFISHH